MMMIYRSDRGGPSAWCMSALGVSLMSAGLAIAVVAGSGGFGEGPEAVEIRNELPASPDELGHELVREHAPHRPGECRECDRYRDWESRPPLPAD